MARNCAACPLDGGEAGDAAFERRHALLENGRGGVHDARVDVAELLQREQSGRVRGILENERRGLVDRHGASQAGLIGSVAGMQAARGKAHLTGGFGLVSHKVFRISRKSRSLSRGNCQAGAPYGSRLI